MGTHSSILAWRIPWTEETGRLQFIRVPNSRTQSDLAHMHTWYRLQLSMRLIFLTTPEIYADRFWCSFSLHSKFPRDLGFAK